MGKSFRQIAIVVFIVLYCAVFVLPIVRSSAILERQYDRTPLTLWHIESFEGGAYSRASWLAKLARNYEQMNKGVLVHIITLTYEQALLKLEQGGAFDLLSFPSRCGQPFLDCLQPIDVYNEVRLDLVGTGVVDGKQYALPYLLGGYLLAVRSQLMSEDSSDAEQAFLSQLDSLLSGQKSPLASSRFNALFTSCSNAFMAPLTALTLTAQQQSGIYSDGIFLPSKTQYEAYNAFLQGQAAFLLGTQRDLYRLNNRVSSGKESGFSYTFLGGFTDLIQYVALGKDTVAMQSKADPASGEDREDTARSEALKALHKSGFAQYLLGEGQRLIPSLEMFSVTHLTLYTQGDLSKFEQVLSKNLSAPNAFCQLEP